MPLKPLIEVI